MQYGLFRITDSEGNSRFEIWPIPNGVTPGVYGRKINALAIGAFPSREEAALAMAAEESLVGDAWAARTY